MKKKILFLMIHVFVLNLIFNANFYINDCTLLI